LLIPLNQEATMTQRRAFLQSAVAGPLLGSGVLRSAMAEFEHWGSLIKRIGFTVDS
jgi:hypothetical protein